MSVATFIGRMRTRQAQLFDTTVTFTRDVAPGSFDPVVAGYAPATPQTVYSGAALVRSTSGGRPAGEHVVTAGEQTEESDGFDVKLPTSADVRVGDIGTVTASTYDTALVGKSMRVLQVTADEWQMSRRCYAVAQTPRPT
jgi:hypothetical protein